MREVCYCGRSGEVEDRDPLWAGDEGQALRCPGCGHLDYLPQLDEGSRRLVFAKSEKRSLARLEEAMGWGGHEKEVA